MKRYYCVEKFKEYTNNDALCTEHRNINIVYKTSQLIIMKNN
jgi:hypothetical protein